ncbi:hypothetical protein SHIRM173S_05181 [Streptomyces hirsutus]
MAVAVHGGRRDLQDRRALDDGGQGPDLRRPGGGTEDPGRRAPRRREEEGRLVRHFDEATWRRERFRVVVEGSTHKFAAHADLRAFLLNTGDRVLVEASPRDRVWGIGLGAKNERASDPAQWRGANLLGFALMQARTRLREAGAQDGLLSGSGPAGRGEGPVSGPAHRIPHPAALTG